MKIKIYENKTELSRNAAEYGAEVLRSVLAAKGSANVVVATAPSQFEMMKHLAESADIDWSKVTLFHLDEYINLPAGHAAGFRVNLQKNFIDLLPVAPAKLYLVDGDNPEQFCQEIQTVMDSLVVDLAFIGVGENGHIAFNDPPADFDTKAAFKIVELDQACRNQQYTEGWFPTLDLVPTTALSMTVPRIFQSKVIVNVVPDERKAAAVKAMLEGEITPNCPASILQNHEDCTLFLDQASASLLSK